MKRKLSSAFLLLSAIAGVAGAAISVTMVIRAVQWNEWGRVILYCVTAAVCVEMALLTIVKLKNKETA